METLRNHPLSSGPTQTGSQAYLQFRAILIIYETPRVLPLWLQTTEGTNTSQAPDPSVSQALCLALSIRGNMANQAGVGENRFYLLYRWLGRILKHLANAKTGKVAYKQPSYRFPDQSGLDESYYVIFSYELTPGRFIRAGEGPIEIGCRADQCEMRERLRKVSEMLAVRPKFL